MAVEIASQGWGFLLQPTGPAGSLKPAATGTTLSIIIIGTSTPPSIWTDNTRTVKLVADGTPLTIRADGSFPGFIDTGEYIGTYTIPGQSPFSHQLDMGGIQGPPGVGANWQGVWSSVVTYALNMGVSYQGFSFISNVAGNLNNTPSVVNNIPTSTAQWTYIDQLPNTVVKSSQFLMPSGGDDGSALGAALAISSPHIVLGTGTFPVAVPNLNFSSRTTIQGAGMDRTTLSLGDVANTNGGLHILGSESAGYPLTADLSEWQQQVIVSPANSVNVTPGALIRLYDPVFSTFWVTTALAVNADTGVITVKDSCPTTMKVANAAVLTVITPVSDITIRDLTIALTPGGTPQLRSIFNVVDFQRVTFERVRFKLLGGNPMPGGGGTYAIQAAYGRTLRLVDCELLDMFCASWSGFQAFSATGVTGVVVRGCSGENVQDGLSMTGCPESRVSDNRFSGRTDTGGRGVKVLNGSNYSTVIGNVLSEFQSIPPLTTNHSVTGIHILDSSHVTAEGNTVRGTGDVGIVSAAATVAGANNLTHHNVIEGNVIANTGTAGQPVAAPTRAGIAVGFGGLGEGDQGSTVVRGNILHGTGGIHVWQSGNDISGNLLDGNPYAATPDIWVRATTATANKIQGNKVRRSAAANVIDTASTGGGNSILDNDTEGAPMNTALSDSVRVLPAQIVVPDAATITVDASTGTVFYILVAGSRTITAPLHPGGMMEARFEIANNTGGAITTTWAGGAGGFRLAGAWVDPAANKRRILTAFYDPSAGVWIETARSAADL